MHYIPKKILILIGLLFFILSGSIFIFYEELFNRPPNILNKAICEVHLPTFEDFINFGKTTPIHDRNLKWFKNQIQNNDSSVEEQIRTNDSISYIGFRHSNLCIQYNEQCNNIHPLFFKKTKYICNNKVNININRFTRNKTIYENYNNKEDMLLDYDEIAEKYDSMLLEINKGPSNISDAEIEKNRKRF